MPHPADPPGRDLTASRPPPQPRAVVLMLHGGRPHGFEPVGSRSASRWRSDVMRRAIDGPLREAGVATHLLRYGVRGWNAGAGPEPSPVPDARWALARLDAEHPGLPVVLLGHSMGARTSTYVADHPSVVGLVALAPWLGPDDPVRTLAGRHLVAVHGSRDRITSARATRAYVERARPVAASAGFVDAGALGHYMLARAGHWNTLALDGCREVLARAGVECTAGRDG